ncbi:hypothetical protein AC20117_06880 [Arthrobacter crystallopoietes]|nr:hypothetical protein AC20117_06880 [Arthrobacter crystallopoietes]
MHTAPILDEERRETLSAPNDPRYLTMPQALDGAAATYPDKKALSYFGKDFTFPEVQSISGALAAALAARGIVKGDRIMVQLQSIPQFVFVAFAAWRIGAIIVPVSPMYRTPEVQKIARDAEPAVLVTANETWAAQGRESIEGTTIRTVITTGMADCAGTVPEAFAHIEDTARDENVLDLLELADSHEGAAPPETLVSPADTAVFTYTSGTTGPPKGALTSHLNLTWAGAAYPEFNGMPGPDHVVLCTAPLVHITGLSLHLSSWISSGSTFVLGYRFEPNVFLDLIEQQQVTWTTGAATAYIALLQAARKQPRNVSSLQRLGSGGAPIPTDMARAIYEVLGVKLQPGYGLTESTAAVSSTPADVDPVIDPDSGIISVGLPMFDTQLRIVDPDGNELPAGERGEVCLRGKGIIGGYWRNDGANQQTFRGGWLHTGDIGFVNESGWLFIVDRTKNMIIASGYKVWPREVEDVLYQHPAVREAAVVGVPDDYRGETVRAYVSVAEDAQRPTTKELIEFCKERLAAYKVPRDIGFLDELPKNFNGKIQHRELKQIASNGEA